MKAKTILLALACLIAAPTPAVMAGNDESAAKKELKQKATKEARNEAKRLKKEGWMPVPGALPLDKQIERSWEAQYTYNEDLRPQYVMGTGQATAQSFDAAKLQAQALARQELASNIATDATALVSTSVGNQQLDPKQAASVTQVISEGKQLISQSLTNVLPMVEGYRTLANGNTEVMIRYAVNSQTSIDIARKMLMQDLSLDDETRQKIADGLGK
ncbi:MAG: hypothetical protein LUD17_01115 [Bacteroidales bacterium]|nr:hypothetical protein [Bacteroidales bacterium]